MIAHCGFCGRIQTATADDSDIYN